MNATLWRRCAMDRIEYPNLLSDEDLAAALNHTHEACAAAEAVFTERQRELSRLVTEALKRPVWQESVSAAVVRAVSREMDYRRSTHEVRSPAAAASPCQEEEPLVARLPTWMRATFQPEDTSDLLPGPPAIGHRGVWESFGPLPSGPYEGQLAWSPATPGRWVPDCDLVDREAADWGAFRSELEAFHRAGREPGSSSL